MLSDKCSFIKRLSAFLIDLLLIFVAAFFLDVLATRPIMNSACGYDKKNENLIVEQVSSYVYVITNDKYEIVVDGNNSEEEILSNYKNNRVLTIKEAVYANEELDSEEYIYYLEKFYSLVDEEILNTLKVESLKFDSSYNFKDDVIESERIAFCDNVFKKVNQDIGLYKDGIIPILLKETSSLYISSIVINYGLSALIFMFIIPMFSKYRQSLGKRIFKLGVINKFYVPANAFLLLTRVLSFLLIELLGSIFLFGLPLLASLVMVLVLKNGCCIHDFLSTTMTIDISEFLPFDNINEYHDFIKNEKEKREKSLRSPYEN